MSKSVSAQVEDKSLTISVPRAAEMLGISEYLVRQLIKNGELPSIRFGRLIRVPRAPLMVRINGEPNNT